MRGHTAPGCQGQPSPLSGGVNAQRGTSGACVNVE